VVAVTRVVAVPGVVAVVAVSFVACVASVASGVVIHPVRGAVIHVLVVGCVRQLAG
jgi:hypothetical protein